MVVTRLPIDPYWINAAQWWLANHNYNNEEFCCWLKEQGVVIVKRYHFYPWLDFHDYEAALIFQLRWA